MEGDREGVRVETPKGPIGQAPVEGQGDRGGETGKAVSIFQGAYHLEERNQAAMERCMKGKQQEWRRAATDAMVEEGGLRTSCTVGDSKA